MVQINPRILGLMTIDHPISFTIKISASLKAKTKKTDLISYSLLKPIHYTCYPTFEPPMQLGDCGASPSCSVNSSGV
ncbi:hypothetical protein CWC30_01730 [Pseudoalteromonas sp. S4741]|nr:hypothetical protein CWC30_01730 [Pseudoalteromonas sp. S4741]